MFFPPRFILPAQGVIKAGDLFLAFCLAYGRVECINGFYRFVLLVGEFSGCERFELLFRHGSCLLVICFGVRK
jgi:hypothetical protein